VIFFFVPCCRGDVVLTWRGSMNTKLNADFPTANAVPRICRNFTPRFKSRDLNSQTFPLILPTTSPSTSNSLPTRDTPCKAHHPSCTMGEKVHPWTQEIQQIYWKCLSINRLCIYSLLESSQSATDGGVGVSSAHRPHICAD